MIPVLHQLDLVHAEAEPLDSKDTEVLVQVGEQADDVLRAYQAFGSKQLEQIRFLLQRLADSAVGDEALIGGKLGEVGYRRI